jgi:hypothetical protein
MEQCALDREIKIEINFTLTTITTERTMTCISAKPARFPPNGSWPLILPADMAAAVMGYENTRQLAKGVTSGDVPPPTGLRLIGKKREPVWAYEICRRYISRRHEVIGENELHHLDVKALI